MNKQCKILKTKEIVYSRDPNDVCIYTILEKKNH
jgi:hypothetical protein